MGCEKETIHKRACLSGKDVAELLEGKVVTAHGVEFVFDGVDLGRIREAVDGLGRKVGDAGSRKR